MYYTPLSNGIMRYIFSYMTNLQILPAICVILATSLFAAGCASQADFRGDMRGGSDAQAARSPIRISENDGLEPIQRQLVDAANWAEGRTNISHGGRRFSLDCSGVVSAVYWKAGIDLQAAYPLYSGNGVTRIYRYLDDKKLLYRPDEPAPGDIIFWDNSYDKNGNGLADDELTHVGMVVAVSPAGDVTYIHHDYISGIIFADMYPPEPSDPERNSGMRMQSLGPTPDGRKTSGELYRNAGRGWELAPTG